MNTSQLLWQAGALDNKRALPVLSFPAAQKFNANVNELVHSADLQAEAMIYVAEHTPTVAAVSLMDLSVEAEAFGCNVRFSADEVPTVIGQLVADASDADALEVPGLEKGRAPLCVEALHLAKQRVTDKPVLAGVIGPFSLAGRLMDVTEILYTCYDEPEAVCTVVDKAADYLIRYIRAFADAGADGVVMAEPLAGLLSPEMAEEFSCRAAKRIVEAVQRADFPVIYHNCGNITVAMLPKIKEIGATAYHFGNSISMKEFLEHAPDDMLCMGNIDPAGQFANGTPQSIREATMNLMRDCGRYVNFVPSSGCDIPYHAKWENIDAFFAAVDDYNRGMR